MKEHLTMIFPQKNLGDLGKCRTFAADLCRKGSDK